MKIRLIFLLAFVLGGLSSCEKEMIDSPGNIQGMGSNQEKPEIKSVFELPDGIFLVNQIKEPDLNDTTKSKFGSGKSERLKITLFNSTSSSRTVFLPKGLIFKNSIPGYHNGILLQTTWMTIDAGTRRDVIVELYCINSGLIHDGQDSDYYFLGVTDSPTFWRLLDIIGWRKINYEMIYGSFKGSQPVTPSGPAYSDITTRLQTIIWNLTDLGIDISDEDKKFIQSIPLLFNDEIPPVDDISSGYPEFFQEFKVFSN